MAESPEEIERVFTNSRIAFCPDTAHLAAGGGDPAALILALSDRIAHVHLKDLVKETVSFQPLGEGDLDFDSILSAIHKVGYDGWLVVELDTYDGDPKTAAEISKKFLENRFS
jgi:inosose dehydratase